MIMHYIHGSGVKIKTLFQKKNVVSTIGFIYTYILLLFIGFFYRTIKNVWVAKKRLREKKILQNNFFFNLKSSCALGSSVKSPLPVLDTCLFRHGQYLCPLQIKILVMLFLIIKQIEIAVESSSERSRKSCKRRRRTREGASSTG